jgi:hypothetical protein
LEYQRKQKRTLSDLLDDISYGAGEGISENLQGLGQMVMHPIDTARQVYGGVKAAVQNPQAALEAAKQGATEAMSSPQAAAKFIGQNFSPVELANGLSNVGKMREMTVYHGTPHKFDAFDASKIGTGEGAQAYGHGIYVAERPEVAKRYQTSLAKDNQASDLNTKLDMVMVGNKKITDYGLDSDAALIDAARNGNEAVKAHASSSLSRWNELANDPTYPFKKYAEEKSAAYSSLLKDIDHNHVSYAGDGSFLTVDLPDSHIDRMLDWEKPWEKQSEFVKKSLKDSGIWKQYKQNLSDFSTPMATRNKEMRGQNIHSFIEYLSDGDSAKASERLRQLGIPGIKYLDQGSRGTGNGTRNFVVFPGEEHNLKILDRK